MQHWVTNSQFFFFCNSLLQSLSPHGIEGNTQLFACCREPNFTPHIAPQAQPLQLHAVSLLP